MVQNESGGQIMVRKSIFILLILIGAHLGMARVLVEMVCDRDSLELYQGEKSMIHFEVKNHTPESIRPGKGYFFSYHIYDKSGKTILYDNRRFIIPRVLRRRKTTSFTLPIYFDYPHPGGYKVEFDIVKEGEFWGSGKGWKTCSLDLHLLPLVSPGFKKEYMAFFKPTGVNEFDQEQYLLRMIMKNSEIRQGERLFGFSAGSNYPAVWIRDLATFIYLAGKYYPHSILEKNLELFLKQQAPGGEIPDWVDVNGKTGKNTVETDQESSLVLAVYEAGLLNRSWLKKSIAGIPVYKRLEMALDWVWNNKRDSQSSLIKSGFTADWGDVEKSYPDHRALDLSDKSIPVLGIYTNSKYIQALEKMIAILDRVGEKAKTGKWQKRKTRLEQAVKKNLYLKDKGYFILHILPGPNDGKYYEMEKNMLAVGGNAEAMIAGLMDRGQVRRFVNVLEQKRREFKLRTVSFTLIPPYPEGFFPHHLLTHPWNYQNGGEWDWIGARVVKGLLMQGFEKQAHTYLLEIVKKNLANFNIFEWEDKTGTGRGALFYTGAAGVIGEVITRYLPGEVEK